MANTLTPPSGYTPPGTYIGEEYDQGEATNNAQVRVATYVGRGSRLIRTTNTALVRGYVYNAPASFSKTAPHTAVLSPIGSGNKTTATLVDGDGAEVRSDLWYYASDYASIILADSAYDATKTYYISYQSGDSTVSDPIAASDLRVIEAVGSQISQDGYTRNQHYFIDTQILEPTAALDTTGAVIQHTNAVASFGPVAHVGTGTGLVSLDSSALFESKYSRAYALAVSAVSGTSITFTWTATPTEAGNDSLPGVPLVKGLAAPTVTVDQTLAQSLTVELELGVRIAVAATGSFVVGDTYTFSAYGPSFFENDAVTENTNQYAAATDVVASDSNTGSGSLTVDPDSYALAKNTNFTVKVTGVDTGVVVGAVNTAQFKFTGNPKDSENVTIGNGRSGTSKLTQVVEFDSNGEQSVAGSVLVTPAASNAAAASGAISFSGTASQCPNDADKVTLTDALGTTKIFEFDIDGTVSTPGATRVIVDTTSGSQSAKTMANFVAAVNASNLNMTAVDTTASGVGSCAFTQGTAGIAGNTTITVAQSGSSIVATSFSGGANAAALPETTAVRFASAINNVYPRLGLVAFQDMADAALVRIIQGSQFVFSTNPVAGETATVALGDVVEVFEFTTTGTVSAGHIAVTIGATLADTMTAYVAAVTGIASLDLVAHAATSGGSNTVTVASTLARSVSLSHTGTSIASVISDAVAAGSLNTGAFTFTSATGLSNVTFSGLAGGQKAGDAPDLVTLAWATSGEVFTGGVLTVTEETADKTLVALYGGLEIKLSKPIASYAHGSLTLVSQPAAGDTVTLNDKVNPAVTFTFVATTTAGSHNVLIGGSIAATVANLRTAIASAGLLFSLSGSGASIVLTHSRSGSTYNAGITASGTAVSVIDLVGGGDNYSVGDSFTFTALAPRTFPTALDTRTTRIVIGTVGQNSTTLVDPNYLLVSYQADTPEGGYGTLETTSALYGHLTLPGQIGIVARNVSRFVKGDVFEVKFVDNNVIYWTLDAKTTETYTSSAILTDRNGAITGAAGSSYLVLKNKPYTDSLKVTVNGSSYTSYTIASGSTIVLLSNLPATVTKIVFSYTYAGKEPSLGTTYYMSAQYLRPASYYNTPKLFSTAAAARAYLEPVTTSNDLAIAAQIAFDQSPTPQLVAVVQVRDSDDDGVFSSTDIDNAIAGCYGVSYISDLTPVNLPGYIDKFMAYNLNANDPFTKKENLTYFGLAIGTSIGDAFTEGSLVYTATQTLQVYGSSPAHGTRIMVAPTTAKKKITLSDNSVVTVTLDGSFVAAALAALNAGQKDNSSDLMHQNILGFTYIETFGDTENKLLGAASINYFKPNGTNIYRLEEDVTVDTTATHYNLILAMKTKHDSVRMMRDYCDTSLIAYVPDTLAAGVSFVKAGILSELNNQVGKGITAPFQDANGNARSPMPSDVQVIQDADDSTLYHFRYLIWTRSPVKRLYGTYSVNEASLTGTL